MNPINNTLLTHKQGLFDQISSAWQSGTGRLRSLILSLTGFLLLLSHVEMANIAPAFADALAIELILGLFIIGVLLADPMFSEHYLLVLSSGSSSQLKNQIPRSNACVPTPAAYAVPQVAHGCRAPPAIFS